MVMASARTSPSGSHQLGTVAPEWGEKTHPRNPCRPRAWHTLGRRSTRGDCVAHPGGEVRLIGPGTPTPGFSKTCRVYGNPLAYRS